MRRITAVICAALMVFGLGACSRKTPGISQPTGAATEPGTDSRETEPGADSVAVTEPDLDFGEEALALLQSYGMDESYLRRAYSFDDAHPNSKGNQAYVLDRMCNSIDYFTTVRAVYLHTEHGSSSLKAYAIDRRIGKAKEVTYAVDEKQARCTPKFYVAVDGDYHLNCNFRDEAQESGAFGFSQPLIEDSEAARQAGSVLMQPLAETLEKESDEPALNSYTVDVDNVGRYVDVTKRYVPTYDVALYRSTDTVGLPYTDAHYMPQDFAMNAMLDFSDWQIDSVGTAENGREIIALSGAYYNATVSAEQRFEIQIDKNTGVLVKEVIYNASGKAVEEFCTLALSIDREIDAAIFDTLQ